MKTKNLIYIIAFFLICFLIFGFVIFSSPIIGVADQGDFYRVLFGIEWPNADYWSNGSDHFFKYVTPDYNFTAFPYEKMYEYPFEVSQIYFIFGGRAISDLIGLGHFSQYVYAVFCAAFYIIGLTLIYASIMPKNMALKTLLGLWLLLIFMDGRWLQWFNSLYGEPIVMTGLLLTAGLFLFIQKYKSRKTPVYIILLLFISEIILLGGKLQSIGFFITVIAINGFIIFLIWHQNPAKWLKIMLVVLLTTLQLYYCVGLYSGSDNSKSNEDRLFQSVFTGLLMNVGNPENAIRELGLDPEFINDIGKTAYLPDEDYTFGPIHGDLMREKFYSKVNNTVVARYYLTHPADFLKGLMYSGQKSLMVIGNGIHPQGSDYAIDHHRFALWSSLRHVLPKNLVFISIIFLMAAAVSVILFRRKQYTFATLIFSLLAGGVLQFPLPYIFNGSCDTAKQLLIFNFIFDICCFIIIAFVIAEIYRMFSPVEEVKSDNPLINT